MWDGGSVKNRLPSFFILWFFLMVFFICFAVSRFLFVHFLCEKFHFDVLVVLLYCFLLSPRPTSRIASKPCC